MTERLPFHFSFSCIGEGNGNPLQCSCLENPRDGKPGGLPSLGLYRVGHDWSDLAAAAAAAYFIHNSLCLCILYPYLAPSPSLSPLVTLVYSLYLCVCFVFVIVTRWLPFFDFVYKWSHTVFAFVWCISLGIMPSKSIYVVANGKISFFFFNGWAI